MSRSASDVRRIVLCFPVLDHHIQQMRTCLVELKADATCDLDHDVELVDAGQERIDELLPTADIFVGHAKVPVDWNRALRSNRLQWIQSSAAGLDHCLVPGVIADNDIAVSSAAGLFAPQVAEQTFCLLFGLLRSLRSFEKARPNREFIRLPTDDLRGKTVGIVGLGGNGRAIASKLAAWDVRVVATDYFPLRKPDHVDQLWNPDGLLKLCEVSDIIILTLPLNASTHGVFSTQQFAAMKPGSYLINVARGQVIDEKSLVNALHRGQLKGVGVDVTETEPLPESSPLWDDDRVLITPHVGAQSSRRVDDTTDLVCENLKRFFHGRPLVNRVDKQLGFPHPDVSWSRFQSEPASLDSLT